MLLSSMTGSCNLAFSLNRFLAIQNATRRRQIRYVKAASGVDWTCHMSGLGGLCLRRGSEMARRNSSRSRVRFAIFVTQIRIIALMFDQPKLNSSVKPESAYPLRAFF